MSNMSGSPCVPTDCSRPVTAITQPASTTKANGRNTILLYYTRPLPPTPGCHLRTSPGRKYKTTGIARRTSVPPSILSRSGGSSALTSVLTLTSTPPNTLAQVCDRLTMTLSPRPQCPKRTTPSSPLALSSIVVESEFSDDSDTENDDFKTPRRRGRGRHMYMRDPRTAGLYTLHELDECDEVHVPSSSPLRGLSIIVPGAPPVLSSSVAVLHTPGSENEDPFALDDMWFGDVAVVEPTPALKLSPKKKKSSTRQGPPPPLDFGCSDTPLSALRYPVSPHQLSFDRPNTPAAPRRSPLALIRPARVSSSAFPVTPAIGVTDHLPTAPVLEEILTKEWESPKRRSLSPEPATPVTPTTPTATDVNLESALRDLLTSCGEYDDFTSDMFSPESTSQKGSSGHVSTKHVPMHHMAPVVIVPPPRSYSIPMPSPSRPRPRSRSLLSRGAERPLATLFSDNTYIAPPLEGLGLGLPNFDKPLPRLEVAEAEDSDDDDDAASIRSFSSVPELGYSSSATSVCSELGSLHADSPASWAAGAKNAGPLYSLPNHALLGLGLGIEAAEEPIKKPQPQPVQSLGRVRRRRLPLPW